MTREKKKQNGTRSLPKDIRAEERSWAYKESQKRVTTDELGNGIWAFSVGKRFLNFSRENLSGYCRSTGDKDWVFFFLFIVGFSFSGMWRGVTMEQLRRKGLEALAESKGSLPVLTSRGRVIGITLEIGRDKSVVVD